MKDLNRVYGYPKLVPQLTTSETPKDQAVLIFLGPKKEGKRLLYNAARQGQASSDAWDAWFWWDDEKEMSKAVIAIFKEDVTEHSLRFYLRRSILSAAGFPGYTGQVGSIFGPYKAPQADGGNAGKPAEAANEVISPVDAGIIRFCDRFLATDSSRNDVRGVIRKEWPKFAADLDKSGFGEPAEK